MLVTLGSRCAGALERASLYERDRDIALTFQHRLMPASAAHPRVDRDRGRLSPGNRNGHRRRLVSSSRRGWRASGGSGR